MSGWVGVVLAEHKEWLGRAIQKISKEEKDENYYYVKILYKGLTNSLTLKLRAISIL